MFTLMSQNPVLAVIVAGEVGFWVVLAVALVVRYALRNRPLSTVLLLSLPLIDVVILVATVLNLRAGATAGLGHGLAAAYLGVTVMFGHSMVRWADQRVAHRFADGPPPWRPPRSGPARVRYEWREWGRFAVAWVIAGVITLVLVAVVGDAARTEALWTAMSRMTVVLVIWLVGWPVWVTVRERARPAR
ncbi:hypothetical protein [Pseudonocardia acaciae]|uniref:hypothetical protein n=1 Tax=Pseudonocardia acaciae TaxID=551276 RepID=UPI00048B799F|nr:hypothetical protein [Pseudonocardia acaciae]